MNFLSRPELLRSRLSLTSTLCAMLVLGAKHCAGGLPDTCAAPMDIGIGQLSGSTAAASASGLEGCGSAAGSPDLWYRFTPSKNCRLTVSLCGSSFDTVLILYDRCPAEGGRSLACSDDLCDLQSVASATASAGRPVWIRVTGFDGDRGSFTMDVQCKGLGEAPPSDDCASAIELTLGEVIEGQTVNATRDGAAGCGSSSSSPDVWYKVTVPEAALLVVESCGSSYDTVLSLHSGCPGTSANELSCNDDACDLQSRVGARVAESETVYIRVAGYDGDTGAFLLRTEVRELPTGGADPVATDMADMAQVGSLQSTVAVAMASTICNGGGENIEWFANPDPRHPFLVFNMYRLFGGRMEQIGLSWVKHGFSAAQEDLCGTGCIGASGEYLGIGCADIYGTGTNSSRENMGPRREINPWTGEFVWEGSHLATTGSSHGPIDHLLQVQNDALDSQRFPDAKYFCEFYVLSADDSEHLNSIAWEPVAVSGRAGNWRFSIDATQAETGSILGAWMPDMQTTIPEELAGDGRCFLGVKVFDSEDGLWRYEYALYNLDMAREVGAFSLPVSSNSQVSGVGFHAVASHEEGFSNEPWEWTRDGSTITWRTELFANNPRANSLRWGTLYNFWFVSDAGPVESTATIDTHRPGGPGRYDGATLGPDPEAPVRFRRGDSNGSGEVDVSDAVHVLNFLFAGGARPSCPDTADSNGDDLLDVSDGVFLLLWLFGGGRVPPAPGPFDCDRESMPGASPLGECRYDGAVC